MRNNSINIKEIAINAGMGLVLYFLLRKYQQQQKFQQEMNDVPIKTDVEIISNSNYQATYFKDSEYFGSYEKPKNYYSNWKLLSQTLDVIRRGYSRAVLIKKGYTPSLDASESAFHKCYAAEIYPKDADYERLFDVVKALVNNGKINIEYELKKNKNVYIILK